MIAPSPIYKPEASVLPIYREEVKYGRPKAVSLLEDVVSSAFALYRLRSSASALKL